MSTLHIEPEVLKPQQVTQQDESAIQEAASPLMNGHSEDGPKLSPPKADESTLEQLDVSHTGDQSTQQSSNENWATSLPEVVTDLTLSSLTEEEMELLITIPPAGSPMEFEEEDSGRSSPESAELSPEKIEEELSESDLEAPSADDKKSEQLSEKIEESLPASVLEAPLGGKKTEELSPEKIEEERPASSLEATSDHKKSEQLSEKIEEGRPASSLDAPSDDKKSEQLSEKIEEGRPASVLEASSGDKKSKDKNVQSEQSQEEAKRPQTPASTAVDEEEDFSGMPPLEDIVKKPDAAKDAQPPKPFKMEDAPRMTDEDGWIDLTGNGGLKKRVIQTGCGHETRPHNGDIVTIAFQRYDMDGKLVEEKDHDEVILGDWDVLPGADMALALMEDKEKAELIVPERFAYMKDEDIKREGGAEPHFKMTLQIKCIERQSEENFVSLERRRRFLETKKERAGLWFSKKYYSLALVCYEKILNFIDKILALDTKEEASSQVAEQFNKEVEACRIIILNNKAACQLKLELWQPCLQSLDEVLDQDPTNLKAVYRKAKVLETQGNLDEAISLLRNLADSNKTCRESLQALLAKKKKQTEEEKKMYQRMFNSSKEKKLSPVKSKPGTAKEPASDCGSSAEKEVEPQEEVVPAKLETAGDKSRDSILRWSTVVGSVAAVAISFLLYRQLSSGSAH